MKHTYLEMVATCSGNILLYINVATKVNNENKIHHVIAATDCKKKTYNIHCRNTSETANIGGKMH